MNSCGTCRSNSTPWERCFAMASILGKPDMPGQSSRRNPSTPRGTLQKGGTIASEVTRLIRRRPDLAIYQRTASYVLSHSFQSRSAPWEW
jgi:hypothetical protein